MLVPKKRIADFYHALLKELNKKNPIQNQTVSIWEKKHMEKNNYIQKTTKHNLKFQKVTKVNT